MGYVVRRNDPYAGGYVTRHYGRPREGVHVVQIEIARGLYMQESRIEKLPRFAAVQRDMRAADRDARGRPAQAAGRLTAGARALGAGTASKKLAAPCGAAKFREETSKKAARRSAAAEVKIGRQSPAGKHFTASQHCERTKPGGGSVPPRAGRPRAARVAPAHAGPLGDGRCVRCSPACSCSPPLLAAASAAPPSSPCAAAIATADRTSPVPLALMRAIGVVETGRPDPRTHAVQPWPWSVDADGQSRFYDTKAEAIAAVRALQAAGVRSIDVGCMQVNLFYHPAAFASLDEAFDPLANARYAARFLAVLYRRDGHLAGGGGGVSLADAGAGCRLRAAGDSGLARDGRAGAALGAARAAEWPGGGDARRGGADADALA